MEELKRSRKPLQDQLRRLAEESLEVLGKSEKDRSELRSLRVNLELLGKVNARVEEYDQKIIEQLSVDKAAEDVVLAEYQEIEELSKLYIGVRGDIEEYNTRRIMVPTGDTTSVHSGPDKKKKYTLPELKLKTFGGNLKEWLGWWCQFRTIHEDEELRTSDKFMYLLQSMEVKSEARRIVESFPMMEANYDSALEALRQRYGRSDLLLQVYLRDLQSVVIAQASGNKRLPLSDFYVEIVSHLRSLAALNLDKADPATWLYPLVESGLSEEMLKAWQRSPLSKADALMAGAESYNEPVKKKTRLDYLMEFIQSEVESNQQIKLAKSSFQEKRNTEPRGLSKWRNTAEVPTIAGLFAGHAPTCGFCDKPHDSENCFKAKEMTIDQRYQILREKKLCFACGKGGHSMFKCRSKHKCGFCGGRHLDLLCNKKEIEKLKRGVESGHERGPPIKKRVIEKGKNGDLQIVSQHMNQCSSSVLLNTVKVFLEQLSGDLMKVRLVGDSASQRSFGTTSSLKNAKFEDAGDEYLQAILFGNEVSIPHRFKKKEVTIIGFNGTRRAINLLEKRSLTGQIREIPDGPWIDDLKQQGITLNDLGNNWSEADILIGNDYWGSIRTGRLVHLPCGLVAEETIFGWTLGGPISSHEEIPNSLPMVAPAAFKTIPPQDIEKLWSLELLGIRDPAETKTLKEEEEEALKNFYSTVERDADGRYIVALPWKLDNSSLPTNRQVAIQRLKSTTRNLMKNNKVEDYDAVFKSWLEEGLIETVTTDAEVRHLIPHRPVFKNSVTTPVRPVYDASCRHGRNHSLNDCLYKGPNLIEYIPSLLLRFGAKKIGVTADIRKAFQMLLVREPDRKFQSFLWWKDAACTVIVIYQHNRVVFGINRSPFLLGATIKYHLEKHESAIAKLLKDSFYVDNMVTSVNNKTEYICLKNEAVEIMKDAKMELRQWGFSQSFGITDDCDLEEITPILGILWDRRKDVLACNIKKLHIGDVVTKRLMLSAVAQVFDPMGYLAPVLLVPKLIIQETWIRKLGWDTEVPESVAKSFEKWLRELPLLTAVNIPRYSKMDDATTEEIHICCDSSKDGMAAVAYLKTTSSEGSKLQFLMCKSRLTPMKKLSIPRSELVSCVIAVRLARIICDSLSIPTEQCVFWSDSATALAWIQRLGDWGVFVSNRVKEILCTSRADQWHHVPGKVNPADLPSRGCSPKTFVESKWWEGPSWLLENPTPFMTSLPDVNEEEVQAEIKKTSVVVHSVALSVGPRFSSYRRNVAVWGWVQRFIHNSSVNLEIYEGKRIKVNQKFLLISELRKAEKCLLLQIQNDVFPLEFTNVGGIQVGRDQDGLLRAITKLTNREDKRDFIYPIVLPSKHPLVDLLIQDIHLYFGHGGIQFLLGKLREKYWVIQSRKTVRRVIRKCVPCRRHSGKPLEVDPAPLPRNRVKDCAVFSTTGVDLAGPLYLKNGSKAWIVLFTCAVYRAVYLDLVTSLTTEDFLGALERFVSIYGRPNTLYSDHGTNFVGAANLFNKVDWESVEERSSTKQIQWIFNPPTAAWWGGFWERLVRSVKDLLKRMLGRSKLTYDEMRTCLCGVASTINDRPLTVVTEDNMDLMPLTPSMLLKQMSYGHVPELVDATGLREGYTKMKRLQKAVQDRFRREYLSLLIMREGKKKDQSISVGDVVLVGADNRRRFEWPLGVITELIQGKDGKVRVAKVRTSTGSFTRPLQKVYPLEISSAVDVKTMQATIGDGNENDGELEKADLAPAPVTNEVKTRSGRVVQKPSRYGQWFHMLERV